MYTAAIIGYEYASYYSPVGVSFLLEYVPSSDSLLEYLPPTVASSYYQSAMSFHEGLSNVTSEQQYQQHAGDNVTNGNGSASSVMFRTNGSASTPSSARREPIDLDLLDSEFYSPQEQQLLNGVSYRDYFSGSTDMFNGSAMRLSQDPLFGNGLHTGFGLFEWSGMGLDNIQYVTLSDVFWYFFPILFRLATLLAGIDFFTRQITARHILERLVNGFRQAFITYAPWEKRAGVKSHPQYEQGGDVLPLYKKQFDLHTASKSKLEAWLDDEEDEDDEAEAMARALGGGKYDQRVGYRNENATVTVGYGKVGSDGEADGHRPMHQLQYGAGSTGHGPGAVSGPGSTLATGGVNISPASKTKAKKVAAVHATEASDEVKRKVIRKLRRMPTKARKSQQLHHEDLAKAFAADRSKTQVF